ncbi:hypothetical protein DL240_04590 [Lujinxingia litoralis]|uniref:PD-(D/E)XK endonuclease-like domain-containing protein n=2 Tax=Lujinxingia litoralis TaxID=2211119 RepID=A0A328CC66_9DELT|nr:hypothetical protein DL240_04590 [Lujinxingia litoralis]
MLELGVVETALGVALICALVFWAIVRALRRRWRRFVARRRGRRARSAEERAGRWLEREGYELIEEQAVRDWVVGIDDGEEVVRLMADWVVERAGKRYVVEVKTGKRAPSIRNSATRRQMLEYLCAYECDGVILMDMESGALHDVRFPVRLRRL